MTDAGYFKIDMGKVNLEAIKPWITQKVTEYMGAEDDVIIEFICSQLEEKFPDGYTMQMNLTGFLNAKNARTFMHELWEILLVAMDESGREPSQLLSKNSQANPTTTDQEEMSESQKMQQIEIQKIITKMMSDSAVQKPRSPSPFKKGNLSHPLKETTSCHDEFPGSKLSSSNKLEEEKDAMSVTVNVNVDFNNSLLISGKKLDLVCSSDVKLDSCSKSKNNFLATKRAKAEAYGRNIFRSPSPNSRDRRSRSRSRNYSPYNKSATVLCHSPRRFTTERSLNKSFHRKGTDRHTSSSTYKRSSQISHIPNKSHHLVRHSTNRVYSDNSASNSPSPKVSWAESDQKLKHNKSFYSRDCRLQDQSKNFDKSSKLPSKCDLEQVRCSRSSREEPYVVHRNRIIQEKSSYYEDGWLQKNKQSISPRRSVSNRYEAVDSSHQYSERLEKRTGEVHKDLLKWPNYDRRSRFLEETHFGGKKVQLVSIDQNQKSYDERDHRLPDSHWKKELYFEKLPSRKMSPLYQKKRKDIRQNIHLESKMAHSAFIEKQVSPKCRSFEKNLRMSPQGNARLYDSKRATTIFENQNSEFYKSRIYINKMPVTHLSRCQPDSSFIDERFGNSRSPSRSRIHEDCRFKKEQYTLRRRSPSPHLYGSNHQHHGGNDEIIDFPSKYHDNSEFEEHANFRKLEHPSREESLRYQSRRLDHHHRQDDENLGYENLLNEKKVEHHIRDESSRYYSNIHSDDENPKSHEFKDGNKYYSKHPAQILNKSPVLSEHCHFDEELYKLQSRYSDNFEAKTRKKSHKIIRDDDVSKRKRDSSRETISHCIKEELTSINSESSPLRKVSKLESGNEELDLIKNEEKKKKKKMKKKHKKNKKHKKHKKEKKNLLSVQEEGMMYNHESSYSIDKNYATNGSEQS